MPLQPLYIEPGICKNTSAYSAAKTFAYGEGRTATGRYVDANNVRFVAGFPEKIGGWTLQNNSIPLFVTIRSMTSWMGASGSVWLATSSDKNVFAANTGTAGLFKDITPQRVLVTNTSLTNVINTSNASPQVTIADTAAVFVVGDWMFVSAATPVGGITFNNWYRVTGGTPGAFVQINAGQAANATVANSGGAVTLEYPRVQLSNPFTTTNTSPVVSVAFTAHGATTGDTTNISGASAVGGITLSGAYPVTVTGANTFTVNAGTPANAGATGGGTPTLTFNITQPSSTSGFSGWSLAPYGSLLLMSPIGGTIYVFDPSLSASVRAHPLLNAPASVFSVFVTPERFVVALGGNGGASEGMSIQWPDQNDFTNWTPSLTNTANSRQLQGGMFFVSGLPIRNGASLAFTDRSVFLLNYTGDTFIYQSPKIADNCGMIGPQAGCVLGEIAYWMSDTEFWMWNGAVVPLPSDDIRDYVFKNISVTNRWKSYVVSNKKYKEVEFHYPSTNATECDSYVIYHTDQQCWSIGTRQATAGIEAPFAFSTPVFCDYNANVMLLESGHDNTTADGNGVHVAALDAYITTSEVDVSNGTQNVDGFGFILDTQRQTGNLALTLNSRYYPEDTVTVTGPFTLTPPSAGRIDFRVDGKEIGFMIESNVLGGDFRLALSRIDVQPSGARR